MGRKKMVANAASASATNGEAARYNKSARIRELFDSGITDVKQIQNHLIADGQPTSLPTIYTTLGTYKKKLAGAGSTSVGKKPAAKAEPKKAVALGNFAGNGLVALEDLTALVAIARKFGGVDPLIGVLQALKGL
jgi:hypothetical protein